MRFAFVNNCHILLSDKSIFLTEIVPTELVNIINSLYF